MSAHPTLSCRRCPCFCRSHVLNASQNLYICCISLLCSSNSSNSQRSLNKQKQKQKQRPLLETFEVMVFCFVALWPSGTPTCHPNTAASVLADPGVSSDP
ncbi:unnamed protein product [Gulo gulo]|uniref:Uncharacterized protein n=1 Tax=Gulo gulo TaxID=48420 RepID=A0A9X9LPH2_GULGU|nr:unnamed protein product [Gulo gulo]